MLDLSTQTIVIASHNKGKVREIAELLSPYVTKVVSAAELDLDEPEETGDTFESNAILKAETAVKATNMVCLADDSGLAVNALSGAPGIYSARWGGQSKDFNLAMKRVDDELADTPDRSASFVCVLALAFPDRKIETFRGEVGGDIVWPPRGDQGFGYDPIFVADGMSQTFAEIDPVKKHQMSHRARAFEKLCQALMPK